MNMQGGKRSKTAEKKMKIGGIGIMAKTKKGNKIVCVGGYTKSNGTKVKGHRRSTPGK